MSPENTSKMGHLAGFCEMTYQKKAEWSPTEQLPKVKQPQRLFCKTTPQNENTWG